MIEVGVMGIDLMREMGRNGVVILLLYYLNYGWTINRYLFGTCVL